MSDVPSNLAALLGSRICHDLISPIGAISNGVELLQMSGAGQGPEIELIHESVENANARIRFFRIAFGVASGTQRMPVSEVHDILGDLTRGTRLRITWHSDTALARAEVKLVFLMIQCLEVALPWGGEISVDQRGDAWSLSGTSERTKDVAPLWQAMQDGSAPPDLGAAEVQFLLFPLLLAEQRRRLTLSVEEGRITAEF